MNGRMFLVTFTHKSGFVTEQFEREETLSDIEGRFNGKEIKIQELIVKKPLNTSKENNTLGLIEALDILNDSFGGDGEILIRSGLDTESIMIKLTVSRDIGHHQEFYITRECIESAAFPVVEEKLRENIKHLKNRILKFKQGE